MALADQRRRHILPVGDHPGQNPAAIFILLDVVQLDAPGLPQQIAQPVVGGRTPGSRKARSPAPAVPMQR